ncbi:MAG: hypothetical protein J2P34_12585, partial [Actinobacteria bacterium]|nr:hypothetical protein [Actinomycetota bacterium]
MTAGQPLASDDVPGVAGCEEEVGGGEDAGVLAGGDGEEEVGGGELDGEAAGLLAGGDGVDAGDGAGADGEACGVRLCRGRPAAAPAVAGACGGPDLLAR